MARASKDEANETATWSIYIPVEMTPNHDEIVFFQNVLDDELQKFGAKSDGWGTFGNKDN